MRPDTFAAALLLLLAAAAGANATTLCLSGLANATASASSSPLCPGGGPCPLLYDLRVNFSSGQLLQFDGWSGSNQARLSNSIGNAFINLYTCTVPSPGVLQLDFQTIYTGGSLTLSWVYSLPAPNCAAPSAWIGETPASLTYGGVLPDGTTLVGTPLPTVPINATTIPCPIDEVLCLDGVVTVDGSGAPTITGCPLSGPCDMRLFAGFRPSTLELDYIDVQVGPVRASLVSTVDLSAATAVCAPGTNVLSLGNVPEFKTNWTLAGDCVDVRSVIDQPGASAPMDAFVLDDILQLGVYSVGGGVNNISTVDALAGNCSLPYSTTPTISETRTPTTTPTPSQTPSPTATPSNTPTPSQTRTTSPTRTATASPTALPTVSPSAPVTPSGTQTSTRTPSNTPTASVTPSQTPSTSQSATRTPTQTPSATPAPTVSATQTGTPGFSPTRTASSTALPTNTPSGTPTRTPSGSNTPTQTGSAGATPSGTPTASNTPTRTPSGTPSATHTPTYSTSATRTVSPSRSSSATPSPSTGFTPPPPDDDDSSGLSSAEIGLIAGLSVAGALLVAALLIGWAWWTQQPPLPARGSATRVRADEQVPLRDLSL